MDIITEVFLLFVKLGLLSVGGGNAILAELQRESVGRGWLTDTQFTEAFAIGQMTPGPGTFWVVPVGYQAAGVPGAVAAVLGFFVPTAIIALVAISAWGRLRDSRWLGAVRDSLLPVGMGLSLAGFYTMARAVLTDVPSAAVAGGAALVLWRTTLPTPLVLLAAGAIGFAATHR